MEGFKQTFSHLYRNETHTCSSGNGTGSDSIIVSALTYELWEVEVK